MEEQKVYVELVETDKPNERKIKLSILANNVMITDTNVDSQIKGEFIIDAEDLKKLMVATSTTDSAALKVHEGGAYFPETRKQMFGLYQGERIGEFFELCQAKYDILYNQAVQAIVNRQKRDIENQQKRDIKYKSAIASFQSWQTIMIGVTALNLVSFLLHLAKL